MQIQIKKALLEGYTPEQIITEAVHSNHPGLDKRLVSNKEKLYGTGFRENGTREHKSYYGNTIPNNRLELANSIRESRKLRDEARSKITGNPNMTGESSNIMDNNLHDNIARAKSRFGLAELNRYDSKLPTDVLMNSVVKTSPTAQTSLSEFQRHPDDWKLFTHGLKARNISSAKQ